MPCLYRHGQERADGNALGTARTPGSGTRAFGLHALQGDSSSDSLLSRLLRFSPPIPTERSLIGLERPYGGSTFANLSYVYARRLYLVSFVSLAPSARGLPPSPQKVPLDGPDAVLSLAAMLSKCGKDDVPHGYVEG